MNTLVPLFFYIFSGATSKEVEYWKLSRAAYILYVHVIPCGSWSRFWSFFRIVRMGLKISVVKCTKLSSSGKNRPLSRGNAFAIWTGFFLYANSKICFPKDNISYSNEVNRMWVNRPESKQKEFGDHPGDAQIFLEVAGYAQHPGLSHSSDKSLSVLNSCHCF